MISEIVVEVGVGVGIVLWYLNYWFSVLVVKKK